MMRSAPRLALLGILALFVAPLVLAWLMYSGAIAFRPEHTENRGQLVIPPEPLEWTWVHQQPPRASARRLDGAWVVLLPIPGDCGPACLQRVHMLRQVRRAAGRHADRLRMAVLLPVAAPGGLAATLRDIDPELYLLSQPSAAFDAALQRSAAATGQASLYLVDPLGNVMMTYRATDDMIKLRDDLDTLLTWSKLGTRS